MNKNLKLAIGHWTMYILQTLLAIVMKDKTTLPAWYWIAYGVWTSGVGSVYWGRYLLDRIHSNGQPT